MENLNENLVIEGTENTDDMAVYDLPAETEESGSGAGTAVVVGLITGAVAIGALAYKKIKAKKDGKPRKRKKLMWVEVEEPAVEEQDDFDDDFVDEDIEKEESEEEKK